MTIEREGRERSFVAEESSRWRVSSFCCTATMGDGGSGNGGLGKLGLGFHLELNLGVI